MPILNAIKLDTISSSGGLIQYDIKQTYTKYVLQGGGGGNLTGGFTVQQDPADDLYEGLTYPIDYRADVVYTGSNAITIFGRQLTATQARNILDINAVYLSGAWAVDVQYVRSQVTTSVAITTGGGTTNANFENVTDYLLTGTGSLTSSYTFQADPALTAPTTPLTVRVLYDCQFALNGNNVTIFGLQLTAEQALKGRIVVEATYNPSPGAAAWIPVIIESSYDNPSLNEGVELTTLTNAGGTFSLSPKLNTITQRIAGSATLIGNVSFVASAGTYRDGDRFEFFYDATMTANGFSTTIFGETLNAAEMLAGDTYIVAVYRLATTSWVTRKLRKPQYGQKEVMSVPVSWEASEIGKISLTVPYNYTLTNVEPSISKTIGVNAGSIAIDISGASTTPASVAVAANATVGTVTSIPITSNNTGILGTVINLTTASATSGRAVVNLTLTRNDNL